MKYNKELTFSGVMLLLLGVIAASSIGLTINYKNNKVIEDVNDIKNIIKSSLSDNNIHYYKYASSDKDAYSDYDGYEWIKGSIESKDPLLSLKLESNGSYTYKFINIPNNSSEIFNKGWNEWNIVLKSIFNDLSYYHGSIQVNTSISNNIGYISSISYFKDDSRSAKWNINNDTIESISSTLKDSNNLIIGTL